MTRVSTTTNTPFTQRKAKKILSEKSPTLKGKALTSKQKGLLGLIAGGGKPMSKKQTQVNLLK